MFVFAVDCNSREFKFQQWCLLVHFQLGENCPRKKPSVANYRKCLGLAVECNNRSTKSTLRFTLLFASRRSNAQEKNRSLLNTGHASWWLRNAIAGGEIQLWCLLVNFFTRGKKSQELNKQLLITEHAWGWLWNATAGSLLIEARAWVGLGNAL